MSSTTTTTYGLNDQELETVFYGLRYRNILMSARPGAGKGTVSANILDLFTAFGKRRFGESFNPETDMFQHVSTGELFRKEVRSGSEIGKQFEGYMNRGEIIPENLANNYVAQELAKDKYKNGFITEGFPKTIGVTFAFYFDLLQKLQVEPLLCINLEVAREVVIERLAGRLNCPACAHDFHKKFKPPQKEGICDHCGGALQHRDDDNEAAIEKRQEVYETKTYPTLERYKEMGILRKVNADQAIDKVTEAVLRTILGAINKSLEGGFFPRIPLDKNRSATFHGHIDAKDANLLKEIIFKVEKQNNDWQHKCYPIHALHLGAQTQNATYKEVYSLLPNFHEIPTTEHFEAFATSKHGENGFDYDLLSSTLEETFKHPNASVMTELEEELFVGGIDETGKLTIETDRMSEDKRMKEFLWSKVRNGEEWKNKMISHVPKWELHHAIDIEKSATDDETNGIPIALTDLHAFCEQNDFQLGGWFVFRKPGTWAFRSNEFSDADTAELAQARLMAQARVLSAFVAELQKKEGSKFAGRKVTTGFSIERVWAIWKIV